MTDLSLFSEEQRKQIEQGIMRGIDTSIYADPTFAPEKMAELRVALVKKLDVTEMLKAGGVLQMREVRFRLEAEQK